MYRVQSRYLCMSFLLLLIIPDVAICAQTLSLNPEDKTLEISGTLSEGVTSFSRHITLTLSGGGNETKQLQTRRSDLTRTDVSGEIIDRGNISVSIVSLTPGQPQDVLVTVNNVAHAGTYEGNISFWLPDQQESDALVITLRLHVAPKIDVKAPAAAALQISRCGPLSCLLSDLWLPQNLAGDKRGLLLDNQTPENVVVLRNDLALRGEKTGRVITSNDIFVRVPGDILPANSSVPIQVDFPNRNALPPDRYVGTLRFALRSADSQPSLGVTLDVRDAPWWPLLILLVGVIVGRLVKSMSSPEAVLQVKLLGRLYRIQNVVLGLQSDSDREVLLRRLDDIKARIDAASETEQALTQELDRVELAARLLRRLEVLDADAMHLPDEALKKQVRDKIRAATVSLLNGDIGECEKAIADIEVKLQQAHDMMVVDNADAAELVKQALESARTVSDFAAEIRDIHAAPPAPQPGKLARWLAFAAGTSLMSAEARYWVWRPIFYLMLLVLLSLLGLKTLYIDAGANFGVQGIYDYLGLFLWGLSADVVQRTLQNLQLGGT